MFLISSSIREQLGTTVGVQFHASVASYPTFLETNGLIESSRSRSLSLDSPNRKSAEAQNAPVVPVLLEQESTVIHANNLES